VRGLGSIEELEFQSLRFVFSSDGEEGVEDACEGLREPDQAREKDSRRADSSPTRWPTERGLRSTSLGVESLPMGQQVACWRIAQAECTPEAEDPANHIRINLLLVVVG